MDERFWHQKWETNDIAFHRSEANPLLVKHFKQISLPQGSRIFLPLCGKTLDISWLLSQGYRVAGAELSQLAIKQLFEGLGLEPKIAMVGAIAHYSAPDIDIFVGDIFQLLGHQLGSVDAIYDRAALVALPPDMRGRYTAHLMAITNRAPQLLICYEYDQSLMAGPPFSISREEVNQHYGDRYDLVFIESVNVSGGLKGNREVNENVWLMKNRA
ncbi:MAG TPA: thiopurine S-methyltransferase [Chroococcidiopsis sp.]